MIIRIEPSGGSFRGAGLYYLHDKAADRSIDRALKPTTDERVWFTDTRNLLETDPQRALDEMWFTAEDQHVLKRANGIRTSGRACNEPVKAMSLSWHKDDQPSPERMIEAADQFLKHMGWQEHQVVYIAHRDTEHRHIHIILNRVHHETGRTLDDYREQKRAQVWALQYEREQGRVRCEQREERARRRERARQPDRVVDTVMQPGPAPVQQPANDHLPYNVIKLTRPFEHAFNADEQARAEQAAADRATLKADQRAEREAFFKDGAKLFKATRHAVYDEVRKEHKAEWRQFYRDSSDARKSAAHASKHAVSRAHYFAKDGQWDRARDAFRDRHSVGNRVEKQLTQAKADLKERQKIALRERQRDACDALRQIRDEQYRELLQRQRDERAALRAGELLDAAGIDVTRKDDTSVTPRAEGPANENRTAETRRPGGQGWQLDSAPPMEQAKVEQSAPEGFVHARTSDAPGLHAPESSPNARQIAQHVQPSAAFARIIDFATDKDGSSIGASVDLSSVVPPASEGAIAPIRGASDLLAGGIGGAASYLADQLGELFGPTPPEMRAAIAEQAAKQAVQERADAPAPAKPTTDYDKMIAEAIRIAEADQHHWKERDRGKGWERDR